MIKGRVIFALGVAATVAAASALAAEEGFYIGGSYGQSTAKGDTGPVLVATPPPTFNTFHYDKDETGWKAFAGYTFLPWLGVEGGYVDLGHGQKNFRSALASAQGEVDANGWEGFLVGYLPIGPIDIFGKLGGIESSIDFKVKATVAGQPTQHNNESESNGMFAYGGGLQYRFGHWAVRAEYEGYDVSKLDDLYFISAGLTYTFFHKEKPVPVAATPTPAPAPKAAPPPAPAKCPDADNDGVCDANDACPNTPPGTRVGPAGCDCDYVLRTHFAFNSAELNAEDKAALDQLAKTLLDPRLHFVTGEIHGYTDNTGPAEYNLKLSKRRADAAAAYLKSKGVAFGDRFTTQGFGEERPIADNGTAEGRAQNRRVSIHRTDCGPPPK
jgi:OmpA-OmpF porin, OOP family